MDKWKYITPSNGGPMITWGPKIETGNLKAPQLYDMKESAYESNNVAAQHPKQVKKFQELVSNVKKTKGYGARKK